jgi:hypothetical protein
MKAGDKIRVQNYCMGRPTGTTDYIVEEFRYCLGIFQSEQHRTSNRFTPLCELFERGPESENKYISNFGEYYTNPVQAWTDLP